MDEVESLSSILDSPFSKGEATHVADTAPPAVEQKVEPVEPAKIEPEVKEAPVIRDEAGRFAKQEKPEEVDGRVKALQAERERRRQAEAELASLREQKPKTDFFENPTQAFSENIEPLQRELLSLKVELESVKSPDFKEALQLVLEKVETDPVLKYQIDNSPDPLKLIYREGKRLKELGDVDGDIMKYREKVTGELKTELSKRDEQIKALTAQLEAVTKAQKELEAIPRSLNKGAESSPRISETDDDSIASLTRFGKTG